MPRTFSRYGILVDWLRSDLAAIDRPDLILVTGLMTYWASGVSETIGELRRVFPERAHRSRWSLCHLMPGSCPRSIPALIGL